MTIGTVRPRTDLGTILLHWGIVIAVVVTVATGTRIGAEGPSSTVVDRAIAPYLPTYRLWVVHITAGVALFAVMVGYTAYLRSAGLTQRVALDASRLRGLRSGGRGRWSALNALLYWLFFIVCGWQVVSGALIHVGLGSRMVALHNVANWIVVGFFVLHILGHLATGGVTQLLRVIRPAPQPLSSLDLRGKTPFEKARILIQEYRTSAIVVVAIISGFLGYGAFASSREQVLSVPSIAPAGRLPGLDRAEWGVARPLRVHTYDGANLDAGTSDVEVRALHDAARLYLAVTWPDATPDQLRGPLVKTGEGWKLEGFRPGKGEDQLAIMFSPSTGMFGPGAFHPGKAPLPGLPRSSSRHGLHYTTDGSKVDVLHWHASDGGGWCDLERIGTPALPTADEATGRNPYRGGITIVGRYGEVRPNAVGPLRSDFPAQPVRLPLVSPDAGPVSPILLQGEAGDAVQAEELLPIGSRVPALLAAASGETPVECRGEWAAGRWTLVISRPLGAIDPAGIPLRTGLSLWFAAFDQTPSDHSRHLRSVKLEILP